MRRRNRSRSPCGPLIKKDDFIALGRTALGDRTALHDAVTGVVFHAGDKVDAIVVKQQMQFDGAFSAPVLRPVEDAGAELNQGGVQTQQFVLEAEAMRPGDQGRSWLV